MLFIVFPLSWNGLLLRFAMALIILSLGAWFGFMWVLNIPPVMIAILFVVMGGLIWFARRRSYPPATLGMLLSAAIAMPLPIALINGLTISKPEQPAGISDEVLSLPADYDNYLEELDSEAYVIFYDTAARQTSVRVYFPEVSAIERFWAYEAASLTLPEASKMYNAFPSRMPVTWPDTIESSYEQGTRVSPYTTFRIDTFRLRGGEPLRAEAEIRVIFPAPYVDGEFFDKTATLHRSLVLHGVSDRFLPYWKARDQWKKQAILFQTPLVLVASIITMVISWGFFYRTFRAVRAYIPPPPPPPLPYQEYLWQPGQVSAPPAPIKAKPAINWGAQLKDESPGVRVLRVEAISPAGRSGLCSGDLIVKLNGRAVKKAKEIHQMVERGSVTLTVERSGQHIDISVPASRR